MSQLKNLLPSTLAILALVLLFQIAGLPASSPTNVDLGFEDVILVKSADDISRLIEGNPTEGFMRVVERGIDIARPRFTVQSVVTLPNLAGSEGAIAFVLLSIASGILCLVKKGKPLS